MKMPCTDCLVFAACKHKEVVYCDKLFEKLEHGVLDRDTRSEVWRWLRKNFNPSVTVSNGFSYKSCVKRKQKATMVNITGITILNGSSEDRELTATVTTGVKNDKKN